MKKLRLLLIPILIMIIVIGFLFTACTKQTVTEPPCQAVASVVGYYNAQGKLLRSDTTVLSCKVCGDELAYFKKMQNVKMIFCAAQPYDSTWMIVGRYCR